MADHAFAVENRQFESRPVTSGLDDRLLGGVRTDVEGANLGELDLDVFWKTTVDFDVAVLFGRNQIATRQYAREPSTPYVVDSDLQAIGRTQRIELHWMMADGQYVAAVGPATGRFMLAKRPPLALCQDQDFGGM